jgi:hypothetical protein
MKKSKKPRTIAPRLANGEKRLTIGHGLPGYVKEGIRDIAYHENQSVSWVLEQIIIAYFDFEEPEYIKRKQNNEETDRTKPQARVISHRPRTSKAS